MAADRTFMNFPDCFVFITTLVWQTVHGSAMTQITANLMEKTLQLTVPGQQSLFQTVQQEALWPLRSLENFSPEITK